MKRVVRRENRVHVSGQDQPAVGLGPNAQHHVLAMRLRHRPAIRRHGFDPGGVFERDFAGQFGECGGQRFGLCHQAIEIARAGVDRAPCQNLIEHRRGIDRCQHPALEERQLGHIQRLSVPIDQGEPSVLGKFEASAG